MALADWLVEQGIEVVLVNPLTVKRNKENYDNSQSKNDPKDAWVIADTVSRGFYSAYSPQAPYYKRLRVIVNQREYWADARANVSNRLVRWIDIYFPEFRSVFKYWDQPRSLATLKSFALPADVKQYSAAEMVELWKVNMRNAGGRTGLGKAAALLAAAKRSIGDTQADAEAKLEIKHLVADYEQLTARLEELEQHIDKLLAEDPVPVKLFSSVKGLSPLYISTIMANAGDLRRYAHGSQLLSMAGLNLAESTSGKRKGQITISKRGRRQLRKYLYLAGMSLVKHNPAFRAWHQYNVEVCRMKKQRSLFKLIGKLARILVAMAHTGEPFRTEPPFPLRSAV
ncbi:transposase [Cohnella thailandensis]|nr:IS110 family transposase [Cohnella thailandensis]MBP1971825.1 transposase [Cohnella thailandensis]